MDSPYKSERRALEIMNDRKGFYEQQKVRNRVTRKILDWPIIDETDESIGEKMSTAEALG